MDLCKYAVLVELLVAELFLETDTNSFDNLLVDNMVEDRLTQSNLIH